MLRQLRLTGTSSPSSGYIEGVIPLPVEGTWQLQYYFGAPAYDRKAVDEAGFPVENAGPPAAADSITGSVGGAAQAFRSLPAVQVLHRRRIGSCATLKRFRVVRDLE